MHGAFTIDRETRMGKRSRRRLRSKGAKLGMGYECLPTLSQHERTGSLCCGKVMTRGAYDFLQMTYLGWATVT